MIKNNKKPKQAFKRGICIFLLCSTLFSILSISIGAAEPTETAGPQMRAAPPVADPKYDFPNGAADVKIRLDGRSVLSGEAAIIDSVTYIPLRSFAELCGADDIQWNSKTRTATVKKENTTIKISDRQQYIEASGRYFYFNEPILNISNRIFLPIRALCKALSVDVAWDAKTRTVVLTSTGRELTPAYSYYKSDDLYWLSRIISAEAGGEPLRGKIAVGNVVLNRKAHASYPNTVYGVIFDRKHGTQFSPVAFGTIYKDPTAESIVAAKICLEGYSIDTGILFFMNPSIATTNWISQNRPYAFRIANHIFYY